jgi:hypothetical protein
MSTSEVQALRQSIEKQIQNGQLSDRRDRDSLYMEAAAPLLKVGRLANEFQAAGSLRATTAAEMPGSNSEDAAVAQRDSDQANKMPRSQGSMDAEQKRTGSWKSGVGSITPVGQGRQTTIGVGRPLFQQDKGN